MINPSLSFYRWFNRLARPKSYLGKFLFVAFMGVHLPLIALVGYVAMRQAGTWHDALPTLLVALVATLAGTGATLFIQSQLLAPLLLTVRALETYRRTRTVPQLPTEFGDDAGVLMASAQNCMTQLEGLLTMKRDLLTVISHDTRNPISQIVTASQLTEMALDQEPVNAERIRGMNEIIRKAGQRQIKLMDSLMALVRSEREAVLVTREEATVESLLTDAADAVALQAENKRVEIRVEDETGAALAAGQKPGALRLDVAKTGQVLNNLLHNAVKFTPEGGMVTLRATREHGRAEDTLVLTVQDTGIGMDENIRTGLFVPFSKVGRAGTAGEASSGLGLWICKLFTEAQGGQIDVQSRVEEGTRFVVRLPWMPVPATREARAANVKSTPVGLFAGGVLAASR